MVIIFFEVFSFFLFVPVFPDRHGDQYLGYLGVVTVVGRLETVQ